MWLFIESNKNIVMDNIISIIDMIYIFREIQVIVDGNLSILYNVEIEIKLLNQKI